LDISNGSDISPRDRPTEGHVVFISYSISDRTVPWSSRRGKIHGSHRHRHRGRGDRAAFDFTNGFHDTANAMATSIATGALKPRTAVLIAGVLNLVGAFLSVQVAKTISSGLVDEGKITPTVIFAGLCGAILWNLLTWLLGLPSSSSHALFGGLIGATIVAAGAGAVNFGNVLSKVLLPAVLSPILAVAVVLIALAGGIYAASRRRPVTADNVNDVPAPVPAGAAA
jgi:hypothetical protein